MKNQYQQNFTKPLLTWFDDHGRKDLPWQHPKSPYRVWISEIMLQQTQVKTVIPYFNAFITSFPDVYSLAAAPLDSVLAHWSGLGYYSRARNLHRAATCIVDDFNGEFPGDNELLQTLPGIGQSTAAAITALAFEQPTPILDGNVKRVLSRYFKVGGPIDAPKTLKQLWEKAEHCMPNSRCSDYTQAIMDLGATCCTRRSPSCDACPLKSTCQAYRDSCVDTYPVPKKAKPLPTKQEQFLLIHVNDLIYLEQRPTSGLWGGLWCMPTIAMDVAPEEHVVAEYGLAVAACEPLKRLKHSFTHFHLHIDAVKVRVTETAQTLPGRWLTQADYTQLGLSKPVRQLLDLFFEAARQD